MNIWSFPFGLAPPFHSPNNMSGQCARRNLAPVRFSKFMRLHDESRLALHRSGFSPGGNLASDGINAD